MKLIIVLSGMGSRMPATYGDFTAQVVPGYSQRAHVFQRRTFATGEEDDFNRAFGKVIADHRYRGNPIHVVALKDDVLLADPENTIRANHAKPAPVASEPAANEPQPIPQGHEAFVPPPEHPYPGDVVPSDIEPAEEIPASALPAVVDVEEETPASPVMPPPIETPKRRPGRPAKPKEGGNAKK